jgi:hypothetical protein
MAGPRFDGASPVQQIAKLERLFRLKCMSVVRYPSGMRKGIMKRIVTAIAAVAFGTMAYVMIGIALASAS